MHTFAFVKSFDVSAILHIYFLLNTVKHGQLISAFSGMFVFPSFINCQSNLTSEVTAGDMQKMNKEWALLKYGDCL